MPVPAPANTYVQYDDWIFYAPRLKWSWEIQPVQNESRTYLIGTQYTLTLRAIVTNDPLGVSAGTSSSHTPGDNLDDMVLQLERPGGMLRIRGLGWDTDVNVGGQSKDLLFGPWTQNLTVTPIGGTLTVEVLWKVTWTVGCTDPVDGVDYIDAYMEGITSIDEYGLAVRTVSGVIRAYSQFISGQVTGNAESIWERVVIPIPAQFRRIHQTWKTDSAQNICKFDITDRELPSILAPVPGTIHTTFSHTTASSGFGGSVGVQVLNTFNATATLPKGADFWNAFNHLIHLISVRTGIMRSNGYDIYITSFSVTEEDIFAQPKISMQLTFLVNRGKGNKDKADVLAFGMSDELGQFDRDQFIQEYSSVSGEWASSMDFHGVSQNRGATRISTELPPLIYGTCSVRSGAITASQVGEPVTNQLESSANAILQDCPSSENSYFYLKHGYTTDSSAGGVIARTNPPDNSAANTGAYTGRQTISDNVTYIPGIGPVNPPNTEEEDDYVVYGSTKPITSLYHAGVAFRIGAPPALPPMDQALIDSHNQGTIAEYDRHQEVYELNNTGGCTMYALVWRIAYWATPTAIKAIMAAAEDASGWQQEPGENE